MNLVKTTAVVLIGATLVTSTAQATAVMTAPNPTSSIANTLRYGANIAKYAKVTPTPMTMIGGTALYFALNALAEVFEEQTPQDKTDEEYAGAVTTPDETLDPLPNDEVDSENAILAGILDGTIDVEEVNGKDLGDTIFDTTGISTTVLDNADDGKLIDLDKALGIKGKIEQAVDEIDAAVNTGTLTAEEETALRATKDKLIEIESKLIELIARDMDQVYVNQILDEVERDQMMQDIYNSVKKD